MTFLRKWLAALLCVLLCMGTGLACAQEESGLPLAQAVLHEMIAGEYAAVVSRFDDTMAAALDEAGLADARNSITALLGEVTGVRAMQEDAASRSVVLLLEHERGSAAFTLVMDEANRIAGMSIAPQSMTQPAPERTLAQGVRAVEVTLFEDSARALRGELLIPAQAGDDTPYVVMAHGSGPSDMDATIGANKPFRDLSYDLAALGVGSLRFDKITYAHPEYPVETIDQEYLEPVGEALRVLRQETGARRVYLLGHSEGGMITPYLVNVCGFDGGISMAGTPMELWEISYAQNLALLQLMPEAGTQAVYAQLETECAKGERLAQMTDEEAAQTTVFGMGGVYLRHMARMDQAQMVLESRKPFLFLWGEKDVQVSEAAFEAWRDRLGAGYTYIRYPALNHLFVPAAQGETIANVQTAYLTPGSVDAQVAADIAAWLKDN